MQSHFIDLSLILFSFLWGREVGSNHRPEVYKTPALPLSYPGIVASWKRFAITILKNDHTCKYMGLAPTKSQAERQRQITEKYKQL